MNMVKIGDKYLFEELRNILKTQFGDYLKKIIINDVDIPNYNHEMGGAFIIIPFKIKREIKPYEFIEFFSKKLLKLKNNSFIQHHFTDLSIHSYIFNVNDNTILINLKFQDKFQKGE